MFPRRSRIPGHSCDAESPINTVDHGRLVPRWYPLDRELSELERALRTRWGQRGTDAARHLTSPRSPATTDPAAPRRGVPAPCGSCSIRGCGGPCHVVASAATACRPLASSPRVWGQALLVVRGARGVPPATSWPGMAPRAGTFRSVVGRPGVWPHVAATTWLAFQSPPRNGVRYDPESCPRLWRQLRPRGRRPPGSRGAALGQP